MLHVGCYMSAYRVEEVTAELASLSWPCGSVHMTMDTAYTASILHMWVSYPHNQMKNL